MSVSRNCLCSFYTKLQIFGNWPKASVSYHATPPMKAETLHCFQFVNFLSLFFQKQVFYEKNFQYTENICQKVVKYYKTSKLLFLQRWIRFIVMRSQTMRSHTVAEKANRLAKCQLDIFPSMGIDRRGKIRWNQKRVGVVFKTFSNVSWNCHRFFINDDLSTDNCCWCLARMIK